MPCPVALSTCISLWLAAHGYQPAQREAVLQQLQGLVPPGSALWCDPEMAVSFGSAPEEIMNMARARNVDLIVMGARASGGGLGTHNPFATTYRVVCEASCPVLTVKN